MNYTAKSSIIKPRAAGQLPGMWNPGDSIPEKELGGQQAYLLSVGAISDPSAEPGSTPSFGDDRPSPAATPVEAVPGQAERISELETAIEKLTAERDQLKGRVSELEDANAVLHKANDQFATQAKRTK